jgi:hypothetical protein
VIATSQEQHARVREIVEQLDHLQAKDAENRRKAPRVPFHLAMAVTVLTGTTPTQVEVFSRNISLAGIGFVSRRMFRREERIAVLLEFPTLPPKLILARITFGRYISQGLYEMGSEFLECRSNPKNPQVIPTAWTLSAQSPKSSN